MIITLCGVDSIDQVLGMAEKTSILGLDRTVETTTETKWLAITAAVIVTVPTTTKVPAMPTIWVTTIRYSLYTLYGSFIILAWLVSVLVAVFNLWCCLFLYITRQYIKYITSKKALGKEKSFYHMFREWCFSRNVHLGIQVIFICSLPITTFLHIGGLSWRIYGKYRSVEVHSKWFLL